MVEGDVGVGKTTFVNYHRYLWENEAQDKLLTPSSEISLSGEVGVRDVLWSITGALLSRFVLLKGSHWVQKRPVLREAVHHKAFTNSDIRRALNLKSPNVAKYLNTLLDKRFIYPQQRSGRQMFYCASEDVRIIRDVPSDLQQRLFEGRTS